MWPWWVFAILAAFVIGGAVAAAVILTKSDSADAPTPTATTPESETVAAAEETTTTTTTTSEGEAVADRFFDCSEIDAFTKLPGIPAPASSGYKVYNNSSGNVYYTSSGDSNTGGSLLRRVDGTPNTWLDPMYVPELNFQAIRISTSGQFLLSRNGANLEVRATHVPSDTENTSIVANLASSVTGTTKTGAIGDYYSFVGDTDDIMTCNTSSPELNLFRKDPGGANTWALTQNIQLPAGADSATYYGNPMFGGGNCMVVAYRHDTNERALAVYHSNSEGLYTKTQELELGTGFLDINYSIIHSLSRSGNALCTHNRNRFYNYYIKNANTYQFEEVPNANADIASIPVNGAAVTMYGDNYVFAQGTGTAQYAANVYVFKYNPNTRVMDLENTMIDVYDTSETFSLWRFGLSEYPMANNVSMVVSLASNTSVEDYRASCIELL